MITNYSTTKYDRQLCFCQDTIVGSSAKLSGLFTARIAVQ